MPTVHKGYDLFETLEGSYFLFSNALPIPANFFGEGSAPFIGVIPFIGVPIRVFTEPRTKKSHQIGATDTIVERKKDVTIHSVPGSGATDIELVHLSLKSASLMKVPVGRHVERWQVYASVSRSQPSTGSMTITLTSEQEGTFDSTLLVIPHFRFERHSDGEERHLDLGAAKLPDVKLKLFTRLSTLEAHEVPFSTKAPATGTALHVAELAPLAVSGTNAEAAAWALHLNKRVEAQ